MKTKTQTIVVCSLTDKEISNAPAVVLHGSLFRLNQDGTETLLMEAEDKKHGDAFLLSALIEKLRDLHEQPRTRQPRVPHATAAEVAGAIRQIGGTVSQAAVAKFLDKPVHATRKGFKRAMQDRTIIRYGRGVYAAAPHQIQKKVAAG
jgi:hypothetical protein